jgi:hypothetical protein
MCGTTAWGMAGLLLVSVGSWAWAGPEIVDLSASDETVPCYGCLEVAFLLDRQYDNPYDPRQIEVEGRFRTPGGAEVVVPGFFMQPYRNAAPDGLTISNPFLQRWEKSGEAGWRVRFCPTVVGRYECYVVARDPTGEVRSAITRFRCTPSDAKGFVRVDVRNPRYFRFDGGEPFIPLGMCVAWAHKHTACDNYDFYLRRLAESGCNAVRVFMCHWNWLEWSPWTRENPQGAMAAYAGPGRYNQMWAQNFDNIFAMCRRHGIRITFALCNGCEELGTRLEYEGWAGHPYNVANGGPCAEPADFWTHPEARRLFKQRLRYLVARWSWDPAIFAFELWNEIGPESPASAAWHEEMAAYLREIDPNKPLVTTSSWDQTPASNLRTFGALDIAQLHYPYLGSVGAMLAAFPEKPVLIGEGGYGAQAAWSHERQTVHESLWQNFFLGAAGPPLTWHQAAKRDGKWSDREGHFEPYPAMARFLERVDPGAQGLVAKTYWATGNPAGPAAYRPVFVTPLLDRWLQRAPEDRFEISPTPGQMELAQLATRLYGRGRGDSRNPPAFVVDYPVQGSFNVLLGEVAGGAVLDVHLDDDRILHHQVSGKGRRLPSGEETVLSVPVPAGRHEIRVENAGGDWMKVRGYLLTGYRDARRCADLRIDALQGPETALLWVRNVCDDSLMRTAGVKPLRQEGCSVTLRGMADGTYEVQRWDTRTGGIVDRGRLPCTAGTIKLALPPITTDVAYKISRPR